MSRRREPQRGMTLVETLVALAVFGIVAAAAASVLGVSITSRERISAAIDDGRMVQTARAILSADLSQTVRRASREGRSEAGSPSFAGGEDIYVSRDEDRATRLVLTRRGRANPDYADERGDLERVRYVFDDGALRRVSRTRIDAADETPEFERTLFEGLAVARFEFFDGAAWRTVWPFQTAAGAIGYVDTEPPRAVALDLAFEDGRSLRMLFLTEIGE